MSALPRTTLLPAWRDGVHDAQATFRCALRALAEPGTIQPLPLDVEGPPPLAAATAVLCLALADCDTPLWIGTGARNAQLEAYLRFHCGCPLTEVAAHAAFALITDPGTIELGRFAHGTPAYPDRSATLLIQVPSLVDGPARLLSGPGIPHTRTLNVGGLPAGFDTQWQANHAAFPLGVDILFCCGKAVAGLPRTTRIVLGGEACT